MDLILASYLLMHGAMAAAAAKGTWLRNAASSNSINAIVLAAIILQAVLEACTDYRHVDNQYNPSSEHSTRNRIIEMAEYYFVSIFVVELAIKVAAFGLIGVDLLYYRYATGRRRSS